MQCTEDEVHFLFQCPTSSMIRNKFYYEVKTLIPNITQLPINILINELMNSPNYFINIQFIKYISACFDVRRGKLLNYWFLNNNFCNTVCICMVMQIKLVVGVINFVEPKCQTPTYQKFYIIRCILVWNVVADELNLCVKGNLHSYYRISLNRIKLCW